MLITFSGLDGSGKTTLIEVAKKTVIKRNKKVTVLTMYDNIAFFSFIRRLRDFCLKNFNFMRGKISGNKAKEEDSKRKKLNFMSLFVDRARGNVRFRQLVYFIDLLIFLIIKFYYLRLKNEVLITDRYFFDSLTDIVIDENGKTRDKWNYIKLFLKIMPTPDLPIFVDIDGDIAFKRKGEYSPYYNKVRRRIYLHIFSLIDQHRIVNNLDLFQSMRKIEKLVSEIID